MIDAFYNLRPLWFQGREIQSHVVFQAGWDIILVNCLVGCIQIIIENLIIRDQSRVVDTRHGIFTFGCACLTLLGLLTRYKHLRPVAGSFLPGCVHLALEWSRRDVWRRPLRRGNRSSAARGRRQLIRFRSTTADLLSTRLSAARVAAWVGLTGVPIGSSDLTSGLG